MAATSRARCSHDPVDWGGCPWPRAAPPTGGFAVVISNLLMRSGSRLRRKPRPTPALAGGPQDSGTEPQTVASYLLDRLSASEKAAWVAVPVAGWANESFQITRRKSVQYCVRVGRKCFYREGHETFSEGEDEKVVIVNAAYLELHVPFVRDRLKRAGIRLGNLLNTTLGQ